MARNQWKSLREAYRTAGNDLWTKDLRNRTLDAVRAAADPSNDLPTAQTTAMSRFSAGAVRPLLVAAITLIATGISLAGMHRFVTDVIWDAGLRFGLFPGADFFAAL